MSIFLMKIIDEYFGRVIVFFIIIFKKFFGRKNQNSKDGLVKNILLIKFWGIGSIVLTTPALNKIRKSYPDSKIYFLTLENNLEMCCEIKQIDEVLTISLSNPFSFFLDFIRKTSSLRKINFDFVFDFEFYTYFSAIIVSLIKTRVSVGFDNLKNNRKILFSKVILFKDKLHTKENFLNLVNVILNDPDYNSNIMNDTRFPELMPGKSYNENGKFIIVVNPNASKLAYERRLPKENFVEIINNITQRFKCNVILIGSKDEENYVNTIHQLINEKDYVVNLCGKTNIKELILLIRSSSCLITNDSGPLHIASALNVPTIAFFGPESPQRYGPLSDKNLVFYKNLQCSPCMSISNSKTINCIYDSPRCMEQFDRNDIIKKIDSFIESLTYVITV